MLQLKFELILMHHMCVCVSVKYTSYGKYFDHLLDVGQHGTGILTNYFCIKKTNKWSIYA